MRLTHDNDNFSWPIGGYFRDMNAFNQRFTGPLPQGSRSGSV